MVMLYTKSPIMWKSRMQKTMALSTAEAEHYSALAAGCEALYFRTLLDRLGFKQKKPTPIYEDNTACIEWGNNVIGGRERAYETPRHVVCLGPERPPKERTAAGGVRFERVSAGDHGRSSGGCGGGRRCIEQDLEQRAQGCVQPRR